MDRGHKVGQKRGREIEKRLLLEMPLTTFSKGHNDTEKKLENIVNIYGKDPPLFGPG